MAFATTVAAGPANETTPTTTGNRTASTVPLPNFNDIRSQLPAIEYPEIPPEDPDSYRSANAEAGPGIASLLVPTDVSLLPSNETLRRSASWNSQLIEGCPESNIFRILGGLLEDEVRAVAPDGTKERYQSGVLPILNRGRFMRPPLDDPDDYEKIHVGVAAIAGIDQCTAFETGSDDHELVSRRGPQLDGVVASSILEGQGDGAYFQEIVATLGKRTVVVISFESDQPKTDQELEDALQAASDRHTEMHQRIAFCESLEDLDFEAERLCKSYSTDWQSLSR